MNNLIKTSKAVITFERKYLLQLRDLKKNIFYPGFWGLFGGRIENNENKKKALVREIKEETNLKINITKEIFSVKFKAVGLKSKRLIIYFECNEIKNQKIILREGRRFKFFSFKELKKIKIIPMDFVAINHHFNYKNKLVSNYK